MKMKTSKIISAAAVLSIVLLSTGLTGCTFGPNNSSRPQKSDDMMLESVEDSSGLPLISIGSENNRTRVLITGNSPLQFGDKLVSLDSDEIKGLSDRARKQVEVLVTKDGFTIREVHLGKAKHLATSVFLSKEIGGQQWTVQVSDMPQ